MARPTSLSFSFLPYFFFFSFFFFSSHRWSWSGDAVCGMFLSRCARLFRLPPLFFFFFSSFWDRKRIQEMGLKIGCDGPPSPLPPLFPFFFFFSGRAFPGALGLSLFWAWLLHPFLLFPLRGWRRSGRHENPALASGRSLVAFLFFPFPLFPFFSLLVVNITRAGEDTKAYSRVDCLPAFHPLFLFLFSFFFPGRRAVRDLG